jgi:hypothetical protein
MTAPVATAVIGPKAQGRNYGLRRYAGSRLTSERQARLSDFALSLAGWAMLRRRRFVGMLPLVADGSAFAVVRARHLGEGELGPIAVAHLLIVEAALLEAIDWASPRLLRLLPEPDDTAFGLEPLTVSPAALSPTAKPMTTPRVGWGDVAVDVGDDDPEAALIALIEGVEPSAQRARLTGWVSTSLIAPAGDLDPARIFKLVTHPSVESPAVFAATHELSSLKTTAEPPLAWKAWLKLAAIAEREPDAAALRSAQWSQDKARQPADDVMFEEIASACAALSPSAMVALLRAVMRHAQGGDAASAALREGVSETFDALVAVADAQGAAFYVRGLADGADPGALKALRGLDTVMAKPAVAAWLGDVAHKLDLASIVGLWAANLTTDPAFADDLALAGTAFLDAVLDAALKRLDDEGARRLAGALLRLHCQRSPHDGARVRRALAALLARPPATADAALADPAVLAAVKTFAPELSADLAARAIPAGLRHAQRPADFTRAAWALVAAASDGRTAR